MLRRNLLLILSWSLVMLNIAFTLPAAADVTTTQELDFGEAVITGNDVPYAINLQSNGNYTSDGVFIFVEDPQEGIYFVDGLPPNTAITSVTVVVDQQMIGPGEDFTIDNFDIDAPSTSNENGEITINLGARLQTSGTSLPYVHNADFESIMTITINY